MATAITSMATATPTLDLTRIQNKSTQIAGQNKLEEKSQLHKTLFRITSHPTLTPFRRRVYRILMSVPPGRWTTYSAISKHLNSGPRAIGNAMKNNPFAPAVPCHRVLATDRSLGGYKGEWVNGENIRRRRWNCCSMKGWSLMVMARRWEFASLILLTYSDCVLSFKRLSTEPLLLLCSWRELRSAPPLPLTYLPGTGNLGYFPWLTKDTYYSLTVYLTRVFGRLVFEC